MNRMYKKVLIIMMAVIAIVQAFFINKINKESNVAVYNNADRAVVNYKSLKDFNDELNCLTEKNILSANEINGKWYVKVKIHGVCQESCRINIFVINIYVFAIF